MPKQKNKKGKIVIKKFLVLVLLTPVFVGCAHDSPSGFPSVTDTPSGTIPSAAPVPTGPITVYPRSAP